MYLDTEAQRDREDYFFSVPLCLKCKPMVFIYFLFKFRK